MPKAQRQASITGKYESTRDYLTESEVTKIMKAAKSIGRHGHRDSTLILVTYHHGLRSIETASLQWDQIDFDRYVMHVNRAKNGSPSTHPLIKRNNDQEVRALRRLKRDQGKGIYVFSSERGGALTTSAIRKMIARAGEKAGLGFKVHPHMLRHGCGYFLANEGQDTRAIQHYLGHRNIQHTVRYTALSHDRFKNFWKD